MLKDILETIVTRYLIAILNLALIFINARVLGIEGVGLIGIIWASISIIVMVNGVLGGSTIVYFINRYPVRMIFPIAYAWTFIGSTIGCGFMGLSGLLPQGYFMDIYLITILYSLVVANSRFLLGKDRVKAFNLTNMLQGGLLFFILIYLYYIMEKKEVGSYVGALYLTNGIAFLISLALLFPYLRKEGNPVDKPENKKPVYSILREMFQYGLWGSADNIAETCTARLNYFFVERFAGIASVGLLDVGTKISESVWNISRSVAYIEYNRIAKTDSVPEQKKITLQLFKVTFIAITAVMICILLIPEWVFTDYLFSPEFKGIKKVIAALSVGIIMLGCNTIVAHYFIGSGKIKYSTASSCVGLIILLIAGSLLIPAYGVTGSAISTSIAFTCMFAFTLSLFIRSTHSSFKDFLVTKEDVEFIKLKLSRK